MHFSSPPTLEKNTLSFIETSALDSTNVEEAFKNILTGRKSKNQCGISCDVWSEDLSVRLLQGLIIIG